MKTESNAVLARLDRIEIMLKKLLPKTPATQAVNTGIQPEMIVDCVCSSTKLERSAIYGRSRMVEIVFPRAIAISLCRTHWTDNCAQIGRHFRRDHSGIIHSCKMVQDRRETEPAFDALYLEIERKVLGK